ncbi:hypothetical protein Sango_3050900 [Sesamum angolense]|uniref:Uncharacterized protein n=1 Tax=Sesamum angolense TaxID=2727404 RepID=A0AAE1TA74_9LAMI|nr:hypothetical protein Sango_3050900 [Sesamum angolense]
MRDCPKRGKLKALVAEADDDEGGSTRVNPLQLKLGLTLAQHSSHIKAVNSEAKPIQGVACVKLKMSAWTGKCNLMVVPLDDFDVILGSLMSAMQVKAGLRHGEQTYLAAMIEIKSDVVQEVPDKVVELLQEFKDVFPPELPKKLPPRPANNHAIELEPGARPPAQAPYRMAPAELAELRKQLDGLLEARLVQPSKAPYGSPVLFERKQDGLMRMYLRSGYWQVRVARGDEQKTTCVTSQGKIQMDRKKVQAVMDWGILSKMADLSSFLGLASYYRRFIKGYSKIANPLKDLLSKYQKWEWTVACDDAYRSLKQAISS